MLEMKTNLRLRMDQTNTMLINSDEQEFRVVGLRSLLHLEERGAECRPPVDDL